MYLFFLGYSYDIPPLFLIFVYFPAVIMTSGNYYDIIGTNEKQATLKAAFGFHVPLANEYPAKQDAERVSVNS